MPYWGLLGAAATAAGVFCLYASWKRLWPRRHFLVPVGWMLLLAAPYFWLRWQGAEFGISLAILGTGLAAWIAVVANLQIRASRATERAEPKAAPDPRAVWRHAALFFIAIPLAGMAGALSSTAASRIFPWSLVNEMVLAVFLFPIAWGAAAYWACADATLLRPALGLIAVSALSAAILYA
jgi:hypothetical protein